MMSNSSALDKIVAHANNNLVVWNEVWNEYSFSNDRLLFSTLRETEINLSVLNYEDYKTKLLTVSQRDFPRRFSHMRVWLAIKCAILALTAYHDSVHMLEMTPEQINIFVNLKVNAAIFLRPAILSMIKHNNACT